MIGAWFKKFAVIFIFPHLLNRVIAARNFRLIKTIYEPWVKN